MAIQRCADMLAASALPLFAHVGADLAGTREAVRLAERTGGVLDHVGSESLLRDLDALRESGGMTTTPMEADVRADVVLLFGEIDSGAELAWLSKSERTNDQILNRRVRTIGEKATEYELLTAVATLRWLIKRPELASEFPDLAEIAEVLRTAKFGVAIWRASRLPDLAVEAIHGLVLDLNETTRFSTLSLPVSDNGVGMQTICGWMTGFPMRTGFSRGWPEHDPWRYDSRRLVCERETDCVIWISSFQNGAAPPHQVDILLDANIDAPNVKPQVHIPVSSPVRGDVLFDWRLGTLTSLGSVAPRATGAAQTVAATLASIRERLEAPC